MQSFGRGLGRGGGLINYDPMREDYEDPSFNSFNPGACDLLTERRRDQGKRLYVTNVPAALTDEGFKNAFRSFGNIVSVRPSINSRNQKIYFIEFDSPMAAQKAVNEMDRKPPLRMVVQYAMDSSEKRRIHDIRQANEDRRSGAESDTGMFLGRGRNPVQSPPKLPPLQGVPPGSIEAKPLEEDDDDKGSQTSTKMPNGYSASTFNYPREDRLVMSGQSYFNDTQGRGSSIRSYNERRKQGIIYSCAQMRDPYAPTGPFNESTIDLGMFSYDRTEGSDEGTPCRVCKKLTSRLCSPCLLPFCSRECLVSDKTHECIEDEEKIGFASQSRGGCDDKSKSGNNVKEKHSPKDYRQRHAEDNTFVRNTPIPSQPEATVSLKPKGPVVTSPSEEFNPQKAGPKKTPTCPLPPNIFTKVLVTFPTNKPNEFWVQKESSSDKQKEFLVKLRNHSRNPDVPLLPPERGAKCMAMWDGDWFRGKIIRVEEGKIEIHYVDFGNTDFVTKDQIKPLPTDCVTESPLAFKVRLAEGTPAKYEKPKMEEMMMLKPVDGKVGDCWVVQVEGVTYKQKEWNLPNEFSNILVGFYDENSKICWAISDKNYNKLVEITNAMESSPPRSNAKLVVGDVFAVFYEGAWARCELKSINPIEVFFIDYGNTAVCEESEIKQVKEDIAKVPPMAFPVKIMSAKKNVFVELEKLRVKPKKEVMGVLHVELEGDEPVETEAEDNTNLQHIISCLNTMDSGILKISQMPSDNHVVGTLSLSPERKDVLSPSKIAEKLKTVKLNINYKGKRGDYVIVEDSDCRKRGYVMRATEDEFVVALYDYGVVKSFPIVSPLPEDMRRFPECSVRCIFSVAFPEESKLEGVTITFKVLQNQRNVILCDFVDFGEAEIVAWEPMIEEAGLPAIQLESGSPVTITSFKSAQCIYVSPVSQKSAAKLEAISQDVAMHCKNAGPLKRKPLTGELVACRFSEDNIFYRAQVTKRRGDKFTVTYVEFGNSEGNRTIEDMKPLSEGLKTVPCFAVKVGLKNIPKVPLSPAVHDYLTRLTTNQVLEIKFTNDLSAVTLTTTKGENINDSIKEMSEPFWRKALRDKTDPSGDNVYMSHHITYTKWPVKESMSIVIMGDLAIGEKLATSTSLDYFHFVTNHMVNEMTEYCKSTPAKSYNPRLNEVVIVKYDDDKWYRAVCSDAAKSGHTISHVLFIDYGNRGPVSLSDIRKMTPDFIDPPALLKRVTIVGIPPQIPESAAKAVNQHLVEGSVHQVVVVEDNPKLGTSSVWIPSLAKILKKMKINVTPPV